MEPTNKQEEQIYQEWQMEVSLYRERLNLAMGTIICIIEDDEGASANILLKSTIALYCLAPPQMQKKLKDSVLNLPEVYEQRRAATLEAFNIIDSSLTDIRNRYSKDD